MQISMLLKKQERNTYCITKYTALMIFHFFINWSSRILQKYIVVSQYYKKQRVVNQTYIK